jgi:hypothetical protein
MRHALLPCMHGSCWHGMFAARAALFFGLPSALRCSLFRSRRARLSFMGYSRAWAVDIPCFSFLLVLWLEHCRQGKYQGVVLPFVKLDLGICTVV